MTNLHGPGVREDCTRTFALFAIFLITPLAAAQPVKVPSPPASVQVQPACKTGRECLEKGKTYYRQRQFQSAIPYFSSAITFDSSEKLVGGFRFGQLAK